MTTLKDVALLAQVSVATVSHVLNGTARVGDQTRERVLSAIRELRYTPNNLAKGLKRKRSDTIGIIAEDITVFNTPEIIDGINEHAEQHGYHILLNNIRLVKRIGNNYNETVRFRDLIRDATKILLGNQVDGIIYVGAHCHDTTGLLGTITKPLIFVYCRSEDPGVVNINYDDELASSMVVKQLLDTGHRRIAIISGRYDSAVSQNRYKGYLQALNDARVAFDPSLVRQGDWGFESGVRVTRELLDHEVPPTAIFAMNDLMATGVIEAALGRGIEVPRDLSVVGFDNREFSQYLRPQLTTVGLPLNAMGQEAARRLLAILGGKEPPIGVEEVLLPCELIQRQSVSPLRSASFH